VDAAATDAAIVLTALQIKFGKVDTRLAFLFVGGRQLALAHRFGVGQHGGVVLLLEVLGVAGGFFLREAVVLRDAGVEVVLHLAPGRVVGRLPGGHGAQDVLHGQQAGLGRPDAFVADWSSNSRTLASTCGHLAT
jgi:hypothetical protein